jgi:endonuclease III
MAESLSQQKKKMRTVMERMKKKYSVAKLLSKDPNLELLIYLVLREDWDFRKAGKALRRLQEEFVDWNEVRVSYHRELAEALAFMKYKDIDGKIKRFQETMREVFNEYNRLNLDFLMEKEFEETRKVLANIEPLGKANAYIFLQCLQDALDEAPPRSSKNLVMSMEALRVGIRLGLIKKTGSLNVGCKEFGKLLEPSEYIAFQHFFVRHAEMVCFSKNPECESCFLNALCKFYKP